MGGLAGMGDLVLTCTGDLSRNRTVGLRIGRGEKLADITASMKAVAEGVLTSRRAAGFRVLVIGSIVPLWMKLHITATARAAAYRTLTAAD